ncbi:hypothetical protein [Polyangium spumosum]|uniref:Kazal-like domain-containing protein n=1 Tax=Polyangium spumosum TaxID=889282 RepID=A0A6N7Q2J2_9BACT|nr:hypothetical protein [Polyangium spumosum]MRG96494.1 hypothetical protein [Polyangium spumosum]
MKILASLVLCAAGLALGCASTQPPQGDPAPTATVAAAPAPTAEAPPPEKPAETATETEAPPPEDRPQAGGRLAFQACSDESRKTQACTRDYRPVCGEVDTGVRCIKAPCPGTTAPRTFPNACTACAEAKVTGYWPMSCEDMQKPTAP